MVTTFWAAAPAALDLAGDEVHVWRIALDVAADTLAQRYATLAPDEQARAGRLLWPVDRDRFIAARGALRMILARYLRATARDLRFDYGPHGKPALRLMETAPGPAITFNLAHTGGLALCAVARGRAVGVDVESIRPALAEERLAERFFAAREVVTLRNLPRAEQPLAFFRCWTRKEAFLKARGDGLTLPLDSFEVTLAPEAPPALLALADAPDEAARWSLCELIPAARHVAALAVVGHGWRLATWDGAALTRK